MLEDMKKGAFWSSNPHWCLRYTDNEAEPFCTTDQAAVLRGVAPGPALNERVPIELVHHPESLVLFPLCMFDRREHIVQNRFVANTNRL